MLTKAEQDFIVYWEENRIRKKKVFRQLAIGLPLAVLLVTGIGINFFSGWYKRADIMLHTDPSLVLVLLAAIIVIVIFVVIFSARHSWEQNEQHFMELRSRRDQSESQP